MFSIPHQELWNASKSETFQANMVPQVENSTPDLIGQIAVKLHTQTIGYVRKVCKKHSWISCLGLGLIPKISHYIIYLADIQKSEENLKLLVLRISDKGYLTCVHRNIYRTQFLRVQWGSL